MGRDTGSRSKGRGKKKIRVAAAARWNIKPGGFVLFNKEGGWGRRNSECALEAPAHLAEGGMTSAAVGREATWGIEGEIPVGRTTLVQT